MVANKGEEGGEGPRSQNGFKGSDWTPEGVGNEGKLDNVIGMRGLKGFGPFHY